MPDDMLDAERQQSIEEVEAVLDYIREKCDHISRGTCPDRFGDNPCIYCRAHRAMRRSLRFLRFPQLRVESAARVGEEVELKEPKRGVLYRRRSRKNDGTWESWGSWMVAELGIPSLLAKAGRDDYEVEEIVSAEDYASLRERLDQAQADALKARSHLAGIVVAEQERAEQAERERDEQKAAAEKATDLADEAANLGIRRTVQRDSLEQQLSAVRELADTLEQWGADNAAESKREGDVADERYQAFQMASDLIRLRLDASPTCREDTSENERLKRVFDAAAKTVFWGTDDPERLKGNLAAQREAIVAFNAPTCPNAHEDGVKVSCSTCGGSGEILKWAIAALEGDKPPTEHWIPCPDCVKRQPEEEEEPEQSWLLAVCDKHPWARVRHVGSELRCHSCEYEGHHAPPAFHHVKVAPVEPDPRRNETLTGRALVEVARSELAHRGQQPEEEGQ